MRAERKIETMRKIAELDVLLRERIELPDSLKIATEQFRDEWNFVRVAHAKRLEKKIHTSGWNFIEIADGLLRSGVGDTSQEAIASALKLALRQVGTNFNAAKVDRIELTCYPWFVLARVAVHPYLIQQGPSLPTFAEVSPDVSPVSSPPRRRRLPAYSSALYPNFASAMPQLKQMLTSTRAAQGGLQ
jgi:hypothetical protein